MLEAVKRPIAHLLCPNAAVLEEAEVTLSKEMQVSGFDSVGRYVHSFQGWMVETFQGLLTLPDEDSGGDVPPNRRPDLLIVDVGSPPEAVDRRILIHRIQEWNRLQEIMVLVDDSRLDRIGYLLQSGLGNLLLWKGDDRKERLLRESRRLVDIARSGLEVAVQRAIGKRVLIRDRSSRVFLSQSSDTRLLAFGVRRFIEMEGHRVWYWITDGADDPPEAPKEEMSRALERSEIMVAIVTSRWLAQPICQEELEYCDKEGKLCLPILVDPRLASEATVKRLLTRCEATRHLEGIGPQVVWAREETLRVLGRPGGP